MKFYTIVAALLLTSLGAWAQKPQVPRKAKELIVVEPSGKQSMLSSYKGKVVVVAFMFTTCPHCQNLAKMFTKVQKDLGPRGFQTLGVVFDEATAAKAQAFVKNYEVGFPVGYASRDTVMSYLGLTDSEGFSVPQVVVVDKKGMIRAQSDAHGSPELQEEPKIRPLIESLLKESGAAKAAPVAAQK